MAMTETQAMNFITRVKADYLRVMSRVEELQATALSLVQEVDAHGGVSTITSAIPDGTWSVTYPFTKSEFTGIAAAFGSLADVLGEHDDLKSNLVKLRE